MASALSIELGDAERSALAAGGTHNAQAQDLVLQSAPRQLDGTEANLEHALELVDRAIALDPDYAEAWAQKGHLLNIQAGLFARSPAQLTELQRRAVAAAKHSIALAPDYGGGYVVLGGIHSNQLDFAEALSNYEQGLSLAGAERGRRGYAVLLGQLGRFDDASREAKTLERADPLNADVFQVEGRIQFNARRYDEALQRVQHSLQLAPGRVNTLAVRAFSLMALGRLDEASRTLTLMPAENGYRLTMEAIVAARRGDLGKSDRTIAEMTSMYQNTVNYQLAEIYAQRGEADRAFEALDAAWAYRDPGLASLRVDPFVDPIREDPRFAALMRKLNFP